MPKPISRRGFITTLSLGTAAPSIFAKNSSYATSLTIPSKSTLEKLKSVDDQFVSVDGWILPTKTLIRGAL
jgi:hypothetical protein